MSVPWARASSTLSDFIFATIASTKRSWMPSVTTSLDEAVQQHDVRSGAHRHGVDAEAAEVDVGHADASAVWMPAAVAADRDLMAIDRGEHISVAVGSEPMVWASGDGPAAFAMRSGGHRV